MAVALCLRGNAPIAGALHVLLSALIKSLGSLLLELCVATAILLMLLGDGRMRGVGEQGGCGFQPHEPPKCASTISHN